MPVSIFSGHLRAAALLCAMTLSGCMATSPRALYALSTFDPLTADPRDVAVAVRTDRNLLLRHGDVELRMALAADDTFDETFVLAVSGVGANQRFEQPVAPGNHVLMAAIAPEDRARFERIQRRAREARAAGTTKGRGTLSVAIRGGCRNGPLDAGSVSARSYMRTAAGGSFFPLTGEIGLREMLGAEAVAAIPSC
ncbi:hypothetical protein [Nitratireductor pacificus]|uniref:Lipoprotein n=1 Tax=Nitratireductor pacificus pht-3B TaxID=391937 RepID=K2MAI0_9HYPH|nr:hypothetical protein [Nitratireductor pacificus]EKF19136.1 hypothetical protein NA2_10148 [Nitratireductor pacificus pht-3B]